jgi:CBS domain containing-hemolysin-like protein
MGDAVGGTVLRLVAMFGLVLLNGFFVAAEFALVSVRKTRMEQLANEGSARARQVNRALEHLDTYIAATQLGITMASLALGFVAEPAIAAILEPLLVQLPFLHGTGAVVSSHTVALVISFAIATALHIVFGELAPKSIALQRPEATSLWVTVPLDIFERVFHLPIAFLNGIGNGVVRLIGLQPTGGHGAVHSVEELELLVHSSREAGLLEQEQELMVAGVFDFGERRASRVMTPRTELHAVPVTISLDELTTEAAEGQHSRLVVYENDLDHILGVVHAKDVLRTLARRQSALGAGETLQPFDVREILRTVPFFPESLPLDELMAALRREGAQVAVTVDEFGGTAGIVTLEDLLEEIVGEVQDEFDTGQETVVAQPDGTFLVDGLMAVEEVDDRFALKIDEPFYETLGGYVFGQLGRAASIGDEVTAPGGQRLRVTELDGLRVARVQLVPAHDEDAVTVLSDESARQ